MTSGHSSLPIHTQGLTMAMATPHAMPCAWGIHRRTSSLHTIINDRQVSQSGSPPSRLPSCGIMRHPSFQMEQLNRDARHPRGSGHLQLYNLAGRSTVSLQYCTSPLPCRQSCAERSALAPEPLGGRIAQSSCRQEPRRCPSSYSFCHIMSRDAWIT